MPAPLLLDLTHTSHTQARTGIQRVARSLHTALGGQAIAITHDPYRAAWRPLAPWELANLATDAAAPRRSARWPFAAKMRGRLQRAFAANAPLLPAAAHGIVVPEVFSPSVAAALPALFAATRGPRIAVFHDAIALKFPEFSPPKTVARFPAYLQELRQFDGIAAISDDSRDSLLDYWRWLGIANPPPVHTIPLGTDSQTSTSRENPVSAATARPAVLCVGSIEGRKNHLALLEACERLWARGVSFELHVIGLGQPETGRAALARLRALQAAGRPLRYDGPVNDAALEAAYAACAFTVYPSCIEGFGLPVIESVARGKACVCSARGALGESARGGGCVSLDRVDAPSLAIAIERLLTAPAELRRLETEARARRFRTWTDYAADLVAWSGTVGRRN